MDIEITIQGTTALICNKFYDEAAQGATSGTRLMAVGDKGSPLEQATKKLYTGLDGSVIIPQPNVFACIIDGGKFHKAGKSKVTTLKSSMIPACLEISGTENGAEIPIQHVDPWRVDTRAVRIPSTGGRILAHRPMFDDWMLTFFAELDTEMMSANTFRAIVDDAGKRIGLGDYRPACKGPFGKFVVKRWTVEEEEKKAA